MPTSPLEDGFVLAMILFLALLCLSLFGGTAEPASTVYVATTGSDSHTCTQAKNQTTPRRSVQQGIACLAGGDTLILGDGTWHEQVSDYADEEHPNTLRPPSGLSWSQPTVIKAANPRQAILDKPQPGYPYNHVVFLARPDTRYVSIEGLVIDGRGNGACVWVGPSSHMRFTGNIIRNCGRNGVYGSVDDQGNGCQDIQLLDNEIFNFSIQETGYPGAHAIYFTGSQSVARNNYIHAPCPFYGIHYTSEHGGLYSNVIENNRVVGCHQAGIFSQGRDSLIRNNLLENNCIGIYLSSAPTPVLNNTIFGFHTAWNCPDSYGIFDKSGGSTLTNNLVLSQAAGWSAIYSHATPPTMQTNLCDAPTPNACQRQAAPGSVVVDGPGGNLTLKPGGPAVNTGTVLTQVPTDRLGVRRPQGTGYDIGAYEYSSTAPPIEPPPIEPPGVPDTTPPSATLTFPLAGAQLSATVTLEATASDDRAVVGLQFKLDGANLGPELTQPPWQYAWNTTTTTPGPHTLDVSVRDAASNFSKSPAVGVTVISAPEPPIAGATPLQCVGLQGTGGIAIACAPQPAGRR